MDCNWWFWRNLQYGLILDTNTFVLYAMKAYDNPACRTVEEFEEDLNNFNILARTCKKEINEDTTNQILNLVLSLLNVFDYEISIKMMFFKVKETNWDTLKTVLTYINRMPKEIIEFNLKDSNIPLCPKMIELLRKI